MIKVIPLANEKRERDRKRGRILLIIGRKGWHITHDEAVELNRQLTKALKRPWYKRLLAK